MTGIIINNLTFGFTSPLFTNLSCTFSDGWTAVVGKNGCGKTTLLNLLAGNLKPLSGSVTVLGTAAYCSQNSIALPAETEQFLFDYSHHTMRLKGILGIENDWAERWNTLSFGERIRFQIACALSGEPDILLADEPTNHLDFESRELVYNSLSLFRGTGLLVSHDRMLLNSLPGHCLFLDPPRAVLRPGNYESGRTEVSREHAEAVHTRAQLQKKVKKLKIEATRKKNLAARADSDRSKKNLHRKDHDGRAKLDLAKLTGRDAVQGKLFTRIQNRIITEEEKLDGINVKQQRDFKIYADYSALRSDFIFRIPSGSVDIGAKTLHFPDLEVKPGDRIGIVGPNGSGKSSLIKFILQSVPMKKCLYIPQEIPPDETASFMQRIRTLPGNIKADIYASMDRLGSDPVRVIESGMPSPGELRKLMLSEGFIQSPAILIMDEPTNHMDLGSAECLEQTLKESECAVLLVSHDNYFLKSLVDTTWMIKVEKLIKENILIVKEPFRPINKCNKEEL